jgi:hypothetical protein
MPAEGRGLGSEPTSKVERGRRLGNLATPISVQRLQTALHAKAKEEPEFRFHALYDKIYRMDALEHAHACCRANKGAPGIDGVTFEGVETYGRELWLGELAKQLRDKKYRPEAVRRVFIPKRIVVTSFPEMDFDVKKLGQPYDTFSGIKVHLHSATGSNFGEGQRSGGRNRRTSLCTLSVFTLRFAHLRGAGYRSTESRSYLVTPYFFAIFPSTPAENASPPSPPIAPAGPQVGPKLKPKSGESKYD